MTANRPYSAHYGLLLNKQLSQNTKSKIYRPLIELILSYEAETWTMTSEDINVFRAFETHRERKMYGPIKEEYS
jgi:hypothetical protein